MPITPPFSPPHTKKLIRRLLAEGKFVSPTAKSHARQEMNNDGLTDLDAINVLRGGIVHPGEPGTGTGGWRYAVETPRMRFVVVFDPEPDFYPADDDDVSEIELILVTGMRLP